METGEGYSQPSTDRVLQDRGWVEAADMKTDTAEGRSRDPSGERGGCAWNPEHRRGVLRWQQDRSPTGSRRGGREIPIG